MHGVYFGIFQNLDIDVDNVKCSASDVNSMATYKYIKACLHCITLHHVRALLSREKESKIAPDVEKGREFGNPGFKQPKLYSVIPRLRFRFIGDLAEVSTVVSDGSCDPLPA
jgi:hypothetical protein